MCAKCSRRGAARRGAARPACRIAIEVGTHSPWLSRELDRLGYEVFVANARQVGLIAGNKKKTDREDAELLARVARFDPQMLRPIRHRGEQAQAGLAMLRARKALVDARTRLINSVRGMVKAVGGRLPKCSTSSFATRVLDHLPASLRPALEPMPIVIAQLTEQIKAMTRDLKKLARERYPETELLSQVHDVGPITSLTYVLTNEARQSHSAPQTLDTSVQRLGASRCAVARTLRPIRDGTLQVGSPQLRVNGRFTDSYPQIRTAHWDDEPPEGPFPNGPYVRPIVRA